LIKRLKDIASNDSIIPKNISNNDLMRTYVNTFEI